VSASSHAETSQAISVMMFAFLSGEPGERAKEEEEKYT
jgi:hypothetical protein